MTDREKVINALGRCESYGYCEDKRCPYYEDTNCLELMRKDALELLKEQKSEWLEDSDPGQEYGITWACMKCMHSIHKPFVWNPYSSGYKYCPHCGAKMEVSVDE